jgi:serine/threonine protein kinase
VQSNRHESDDENTSLNVLQSCLNDFLSQRLSFDELRTSWITAVSSDPEVRSAALRLLYEQPHSKHLPAARILSLKRVAETAFDDDSDDWTVEMEVKDRVASRPVPTSNPSSASNGASLGAKAGKDDQARSIFEQRTKTPPSKPRIGDSLAELATGDVLNDRFILQEQLGRGGNGIVFRARDRFRESADAATCEVAIKVLCQGSRSDRRRVDGLRNEAVLTQSLSHPNIVRVYDFYESGNRHFFSMELLRGEALKSLLSRLHPAVMPKSRAFKIIQGMCRGLVYAHESGCVHADIKPGNVFLTDDDETKLLDFGLARGSSLGAHSDGEADESNPSAIRANTPSYASCNRLLGGEPSYKDDVYSLSCVIYELLKGCHPYQRKPATEVRASGLKPQRIAGLNDLQWRTLESGLGSTSPNGAPQVRDLLAAFSPEITTEPVHTEVAPEPPRSWAPLMVFGAFFCGAGFTLALGLLGIQPISSHYVDQIRESTVFRTVRSTLGIEEGDAAAAEEPNSLPAFSKTKRDVDAASVDSSNTLRAPTSAEVASEVATAEPARTSEAGLEPNLPTAIFVDEDAMLSAPSSPIQTEETFAETASQPVFQIDSAVYSISEQEPALAVQISRKGDISSAAHIALTTLGRSAASDVDFVSFGSQQLRFEAGEASRTFFIPIIDDALIEGDELFEIILSTTDAKAVLKDPSSAVVIIIDNDTYGE